MRFADRRAAGVILGEAIAAAAPEEPVVMALPRGGVPVGYEVASKLRCPLDVILVRKIGMPGQPELAIGAVAENGHRILNTQVLGTGLVKEAELTEATDKALRELEERVKKYRPQIIPIDVRGRTVVIVDDGLATGSTARAAIKAVRLSMPAAVWLAVPVAPAGTVGAMSDLVDRMVVLHQPESFGAVGYWYDDFSQTSDAEVRNLLLRPRGEG